MVAPERVWTPWRMRYLSGHAQEDGCVFCNRVAGTNDVDSLILHRATHNFVIMNLFPYGSGHIMIVPNEHVAEPGALTANARHEMADLVPTLMQTLQKVLGCEGFNVGMNLGAAGGAGIAAHLHQHLVPRWNGDANFMPIIAATKALPETLPAQYARIRAELEQNRSSAPIWKAVVLDRALTSVVAVNRTLPEFACAPGVPVWRSAVSLASSFADGVEVVGWGGDVRAGGSSEAALTLVGDLKSDAPVVSIKNADLDEPDQVVLQRALNQLSPLV